MAAVVAAILLFFDPTIPQMNGPETVTNRGKRLENPVNDND